jgi:hypothetical protein
MPPPSLLKGLQEEFPCFISWRLPAYQNTGETEQLHPVNRRQKTPEEYFQEYYTQVYSTPPSDDTIKAFVELLNEIQ